MCTKFVLIRGKLAIHGQTYQMYLALTYISSNGQGLMVQAYLRLSIEHVPKNRLPSSFLKNKLETREHVN